jgi:hypothetical protein
MTLSLLTRGALGALAGLTARGLLRRRRRTTAVGSAARRLRAGAATLATSVLLDSAAEHYRGGFYNPTMYLAPAVSASTLAASAGGPGALQRSVFGLAGLTGLVGAGFHVYNVARRTGGVRWENLLYGAPLAAPIGITAAGLAGLAAQSLDGDGRLLGLPAGPLLTAGAAAGLAGTAAEAGLLHFRGAFHDPFMWLPVTVPPLAAVALGLAAARPSRGTLGAARLLTEATVGVGLLGVGFHALGVARNMGGWKNWTQNLQVAPPLPAPPSFTGMALVGLAGLTLLAHDR